MPNKVNLNPEQFPQELRPLLSNAIVYDSSSSPSAKVYYLEKEKGYFLKTAAKGALKTEAEMTEYLNRFSLASPVFCYLSADRDYLVTHKIKGGDCSSSRYLQQPERLCDCLAEALRLLHGLDFKDCPVKNHTERYLAAAERNFRTGSYDKNAPKNFGFAYAEEAYARVRSLGKTLKTDTLIHGDSCLPNIILYNWKLSGFIDLGNGGAGDRHVDLFWTIWSLGFNLKTDKYGERFKDAYGRNSIDEDKLRTIAAIEVFG